MVGHINIHFKLWSTGCFLSIFRFSSILSFLTDGKNDFLKWPKMGLNILKTQKYFISSDKSTNLCLGRLLAPGVGFKLCEDDFYYRRCCPVVTCTRVQLILIPSLTPLHTCSTPRPDQLTSSSLPRQSLTLLPTFLGTRPYIPNPRLPPLSCSPLTFIF